MDRLYMAAKSISNDVRRKSASGGIFFELAKLVLDENGIVYGAAFTESWEVQHKRKNFQNYRVLNIRKVQ